MKRPGLLIYLCLILAGAPFKVFAINAAIQKLYPRTLLTNDYGILNEADFQAYNSSTQVGVNSWQCFQTSAVSVSLNELGYDSDAKLKFAALKITVRLKRNVIHEYELTRALPVEDCKDKLTIWKNLLSQDKYVCLGGSFVEREKQTRHGAKLQVYGWVFDRIKTKKGCSAYYMNCAL